ncbi:MAG: 4Fe-4S dicluster domain-containing protein [Synergistaceae bacterium]|jgi:ferredoxin|nr:4Fe-4S dicluster domain-containing protein [Synergistaceae bacterium]
MDKKSDSLSSRRYYKFAFVLRCSVAVLFLAAFLFVYASSSRNDITSRLLWTQFSGGISRGGVISALFIGVVASALMFGRIYCSVLCPMGTLQEIVWRISGSIGRVWGRKNKKRRYVRPWKIRYLVPLLASAGFVLVDPLLVIILDPISNFGRGITSLLSIWRGDVRGITIGFLVMFAAILVLSAARGRRFCDWCPVGTVLGLASRLAPLGMKIGEGCVSCGICEGACPMNCIDAGARKLERDRCVLCVACASSCPGSFISCGAADAAGSLARAGRRGFLKGAVPYVMGLAYLLGRNLRNLSADPSDFSRAMERSEGIEGAIMPPGAGDVVNYSSHCVGCQACVAACPVKVIKAIASAKPELSYADGYCQYSCVECGKVCPSGAIRHLSVAEKRMTRVALSRLDLSKCVVVTKSQACGACAEVCPTRALRMEPYGGRPGLTIPVFEEEYCIGCGACLYACPAQPKAFTIEGAAAQTLTPGMRPTLEEDEGLPALPDTDDFPF